MTLDPLDLVIGDRPDGRLTIRPLHRENPSATDYDDGNWVTSEVSIFAGGFRGTVATALCAQDFQAFRDQLLPLQSSLTGTAVFETMEE
jgi:hypothetical protein